ncbi:hypothetical protein MAR_026684, partial [Mya arenaria]
TVCKSHGAHVVFVETGEENLFIADFTQSSRSGGDSFFLGVTDCDGPPSIYKLYGTTQSATYINFMSTEGNDTTPSSCCVLLDGRSHQQWTDFYCSSSKRAVCEKEMYKTL